MKRTKIFFAYRHIEEPWGGANNFIRSLYNELSKNPVYFVHHNVNLHSDILFFNHLSYGPGNVALESKKLYNLSDIKELKNKNQAKVVVRAVNLHINSDCLTLKSKMLYLKNYLFLDINTIKFLNFADFVIFQSEFQRSFFQKWGYHGKNNAVIHNGAPLIFKNDNFLIKPIKNKIKLVSNSNFKNFKRHDIVAKMSLLDEIEVTHVGKWSNKIKRHKVNLQGILSQREIVKIYANSDYLLHPAESDPCPNAVIEALYFGLPVIFNKKGGGSPEIVRGNGIEINENDLKKTLHMAKDNFISLKQKLMNERDYYSIKRAAGEYIEVFKNINKL